MRVSRRNEPGRAGRVWHEAGENWAVRPWNSARGRGGTGHQGNELPLAACSEPEGWCARLWAWGRVRGVHRGPWALRTMAVSGHDDWDEHGLPRKIFHGRRGVHGRLEEGEPPLSQSTRDEEGGSLPMRAVGRDVGLVMNSGRQSPNLTTPPSILMKVGNP